MPNIPQINLPGANVPGGAPPPQAPHLAPTSIGVPVLQGLAVNHPPVPPNIPPPGGIPPAGLAPIGFPAVPPLVAQAPPLQFPPPPAAPAAPAPLPVPHAGDRGEITDPPILTNVPIGLPETLLGIPPPQFQGMCNFAPSSFLLSAKTNE